MNNEEKILAILEQLQQGQAKLEQGQEAMQTDINDLRQGQAKLEHGQETMQANINDLWQGQKSIVARLDEVEATLQTVHKSQMKFELEQIPRITAALDGLSGLQEKFNRLDRLETKQEDHGNRILALEFAVQTK